MKIILAVPPYRKDGKTALLNKELLCKQCGKIFLNKKRNKESKFCSRGCFKKSMIGNKSRLGLKHSIETIKKISFSHLGIRPSIETRKKISKSLIGLTGNKARAWKNGFLFNRKGYTFKYVSPYKHRALHRILIENSIGRRLKKKEVVHHVDGNKSNNSIENLMLFKNNSEHIRFHSRNKIL